MECLTKTLNSLNNVYFLTLTTKYILFIDYLQSMVVVMITFLRINQFCDTITLFNHLKLRIHTVNRNQYFQQRFSISFGTISFYKSHKIRQSTN